MINERESKQQLRSQRLPDSLLKKQLVLLLFSCALLLLFFFLPRNHEWLLGRPVKYVKEFLHQKDHLSSEYRKENRWGSDYVLSKKIAGFFEQRNNKGKALVLLPPKGYFEKRKIEYNVPEPAVFYYYTGLKTVWVNSKDADKANWLVRVYNGTLIIESITDRRALADSIRAFKNYKLSL